MKFLLLVLPALLLAACQGVGPRFLAADRGLYNLALQRTNNEQLLLNVVRLRYRDTPVFVEVTGVASKLRVTQETNVGVTLRNGQSTPWELGTGTTWSEEPTISYSPLQGDRFVRELLQPIDLGTIVMLCQTGWSIGRVTRLCAQNLNGVPNAPRASGPTPETRPEFEEFLRVTELLRELQLASALRMGFERRGEAGEGPPMRALVQFTDGARPARDELYERLNLDPEQQTFDLTAGVAADRQQGLLFLSRSLMAVLFYVSQGVHVPERDVEAGRVTVTRDEDGNVFDWSELTGGLLEVHSSSEAPENAAVSVYYRDAWFWIDDSDLESKSTFALLQQLFALQAGEIQSAGPILTLDV